MKLFYHVACLGIWRRVLAEQIELFRRIGLEPSAGVLGSQAQIEEVRHRIPVIYASEDLQEFETPTLFHLWQWCIKNPTGVVIYVHTKGVSKPSPMRWAWRKVMEYWVLEPWRDNLKLLDNADVVGVNWRNSAFKSPTPHFTGNFWMARAGWIAGLDSPWIHRSRGDPLWELQNRDTVWQNPPLATWERMHAEMWLGSKSGCIAASLGCRNRKITQGRIFFRLLREIKHWKKTAV